MSVIIFSTCSSFAFATSFYSKSEDTLFASQGTPTLDSLQSRYISQKNTRYFIASPMIFFRLHPLKIHNPLVKDHFQITFQMENTSPLTLLYVIYTSSGIGITLQVKTDFIQSGSFVTLTNHGIQQLNAVLIPGVTYSLLAEGSSSHGFVFMAMPTKTIIYKVPTLQFTKYFSTKALIKS